MQAKASKEETSWTKTFLHLCTFLLALGWAVQRRSSHCANTRTKATYLKIVEGRRKPPTTALLRAAPQPPFLGSDQGLCVEVSRAIFLKRSWTIYMTRHDTSVEPWLCSPSLTGITSYHCCLSASLYPSGQPLIFLCLYIFQISKKNMNCDCNMGCFTYTSWPNSLGYTWLLQNSVVTGPPSGTELLSSLWPTWPPLLTGWANNFLSTPQSSVI